MLQVEARARVEAVQRIGPAILAARGQSSGTGPRAVWPLSGGPVTSEEGAMKHAVGVATDGVQAHATSAVTS